LLEVPEGVKVTIKTRNVVVEGELARAQKDFELRLTFGEQVPE
jgi:ribosomal protein L6P/L9E